ncbi:ferritin-like domain-containing protein [Halorientalis salina]|uniref:ferritin-like domain-containing protein n=1 Tax=Halorientalis salina TaxID=2932266 RepID=UPI0010AD2C75|nr:ferritin-like domain-containing protein [Halorientalis salina]
MSVQQPVASDHQLARLLQIGIVLEEVVEARAGEHAKTLDVTDPELEALLDEAAAESADHRDRLEALIDELEAETIPFEQIKELVAAQYEAESDFDGVLYDQLCNEETAYKFYDDLIGAIEASDAAFSIDRDRLLDTLSAIRDDEADGVEDVAELMEARE